MGLFLSVQEPLLSQKCCNALSSISQLNDHVYYPENEQYKLRLQSYFSANAAQESWCMVMPQNDDDVSKIAGVVSKHQCPFGIRSGGHATWKGSSSVKDGFTIDFGEMNTVGYDRANNIVSIQPGATAAQVYKFLDQFNVTIAGPRTAVVSLGGFITGGGYSFYANAYGIACDTVENFRVVLADGRIVNANKDSDPELWKALKGGSGNFGLVTRIDTRAILSNKIHSHYLTYDDSKANIIFKTYIGYVNRMNENPASQANIGINISPGRQRIHAELTSTKSLNMPSEFSGFFYPEAETHRITSGTMSELADRISGREEQKNTNVTWTTSMFSNDIQILQFVNENKAEYVKKMSIAAPGSKFNIFIQFNPVTASMIAHSRNAGGNVLGLEDITANGPVMQLLISLNADSEEAHKRLGPILIEFREGLNEFATQKGLNKNWEYLNYALGDQNPIKHYGKKSVDFLEATALKYDPNQVFQDLRSTGFKLKDSSAVKSEGL